MKKFVLVMTMCAFLSVTNAVLVTNGDFPGTNEYWDATGGAGFSVTLDPGGFITIDAASGSWGVWYQTIEEPLAELGIPAGTDVVMTADVKSISGGYEGAALKIEAWQGGSNTNIGWEEVVGPVTGSWANYQAPAFTIPANADALKCVLVHKGYSTAVFGFDNVEIVIDPNNNPALKPNPIVGGAMNPVDDVISWVNPGNAVSADVYIIESATPLPDPDPRTATPITTTGESLDLSDNGFNVSSGMIYYWAVDVTNDTNDVEGFLWNFITQTVDAGPDQYIWLTGDPAAAQINLSSSITGSPDSILWEDISDPLEQAPGTTVTINSATSASTTVDVDGDGWLLFRCTATYNGIEISDEVNVGVYTSPCKAAQEDPTDIPATYPDGHGDINGDCEVTFADFVLMASSWLDCMSDKLGCN